MKSGGGDMVFRPDSDGFLTKRLEELASRAENTGSFFFTDFLDEGELGVFYSVEPVLQSVKCTVYGGYDGAERCMVRFGPLMGPGYEEAFPISCLHAAPRSERYADELTHRDFLGAVMNLGLERCVTGDLLVSGTDCYIFCESRIGAYICDNLSRVKRTEVFCEKAGELPDGFKKARIRLTAQAASVRVDAVLAQLCSLSRSRCDELFSMKKIFINGRPCGNRSYLLKEKDIISVRGIGKFQFLGTDGTTRKGRLVIVYEKYA